MLIDAPIITSVWVETHLVEILLTSFGATLVAMAGRLSYKVGKVQDDITTIKLDLVSTYRRKDDCPKPTECPQERKAPSSNPPQDLATGVSKINTDLAVLTNDIEDLRSLAAGTTLHKATA